MAFSWPVSSTLDSGGDGAAAAAAAATPSSSPPPPPPPPPEEEEEEEGESYDQDDFDADSTGTGIGDLFDDGDTEIVDARKRVCTDLKRLKELRRDLDRAEREYVAIGTLNLRMKIPKSCLTHVGIGKLRTLQKSLETPGMRNLRPCVRCARNKKRCVTLPGGGACSNCDKSGDACRFNVRV
jgi:hypothetical protein